MRVLIIGGTGVISTAIVQRLIDEGHEAVVLNRGLRTVRYKGNVEQIVADKKDEVAFEKAVGACSFDAVIDMISYNPEDAALTLRAAKNAKHIVFTSTVAVYKRPYNGVPIKETHPRFDTDIFPYGYHKARMEDYLQQKMDEGMPITVLRPSLTFGIGGKNVGIMRNNYGIVSRIRSGKPVVMFGDGTNPWAFTFAPDLAKAYVGVLLKPVCMGQMYHATSDDHHTWDDLYTTFGRIVGCAPKIVHISTEMLMAVSADTFSHLYFEKMHCGIFDNTKIKQHVPEFDCTFTLEKLLRELLAWYESDEEAGVVDPRLEALEDSIVQKYEACIHIMASNEK